ncbi:alpha/beta fold hydrolase [Tenacibaculum haliotis]|uniref:alpha/beta fold hydrolase n=1 Tax=Tenacibaculum haliotis TaxID=1888914 RepID=UPI0021AF7E03|nr:alpha/beta hydrolase [Tenacibaculum haliotis]MCT4698811.1 alpha/beta hydrolase [Tenacibaculum haliotis]
MKKIVKVTLLIIALVFTSIVVFYGYQDIPVEKLKEKYANKASSFVAINGMDVHYRDEGVKSDSIPIVLIHGTGASLHTFDAWTDELKKTKRVIRMDLPAYGLTGPFPDRNYSMNNYVKFIHDFLSSLKIKECILGGNSLGGQIAWNFTVNYPNNVKKNDFN